MVDFRTERTIKEWLSITPQRLVDKLAFAPLMVWCVLPIFLMLANLWFPNEKHIINYYVMVGCGVAGLLVGVVSILRQKVTGKRREIKDLFREYPERFFFAGMLLLGFVSCFFAQNISKAFISNFYRNDGFSSYIFYVGFFMASIALKDEKLRGIILHTVSTVATVLSILTFLQLNSVPIKVFVNYRGMLSAVFENSNHFGYYLVIAAIVTAILFVVKKKLWMKLLLASQFLVICIGLFANDTFGCYSAVGLGLICCAIVLAMVSKRMGISAVLLLIIFSSASIAYDLGYGTISTNLKSLFTDSNKIIIENDDTAGTNRWGLWKDAIYFIGQKPLFGYGIENMEEAYENYKPMKYDRPHNEYLQHAVFMGIPAAVLYLAGLYALFLRCFKHRKKLTGSELVGIFATGGYLFSAFFGNTMFYTMPYYMIVLAMASSHNHTILTTD